MNGLRQWRDVAVIEFDTDAHATLQNVSLRPLSDPLEWQGQQVFLLARPRDGQLFVVGPAGLPDQVIEAVVETHRHNSEWALISTPGQVPQPSRNLGGIEQ